MERPKFAETTALGGLRTHLARPNEPFQPSNITWAHVPPHGDRRLKKRDRYQAMAERALVDIAPWIERVRVPVS